jgi:hypothetical protein
MAVTIPLLAISYITQLTHGSTIVFAIFFTFVFGIVLFAASQEIAND